MLNNLIASRTRIKILTLFFQDPASTHYLREIVRITSEEVNAVKRELDILDKAKVLDRERRLNKVFYTLNKHYIFYEEFLKMFAKTNSLATALLKNSSRIGKLKYLAISLKFAKKQPIAQDEVYVLFVGTIVVPEVASIVEAAEKEYKSGINYTVMTDEEFIFRKRQNDPFLWRFLRQSKIMLVGQEDELMK